MLPRLGVCRAASVDLMEASSRGCQGCAGGCQRLRKPEPQSPLGGYHGMNHTLAMKPTARALGRSQSHPHLRLSVLISFFFKIFFDVDNF